MQLLTSILGFERMTNNLFGLSVNIFNFLVATMTANSPRQSRIGCCPVGDNKNTANIAAVSNDL
jgi:hypothetical protein